jgi:hypothetical protein
MAERGNFANVVEVFERDGGRLYLCNGHGGALPIDRHRRLGR